HRWLGGITFGFALFFLSYSAWNVAGFGATERLGAEQYRTKLEKAAEARRKERTEAFREQAQWARSTAVEQRGVDSKRALMGESTAILEKAFNEPVRVDKELPPDAQATLASDITGKDSSWFQKADVIALAILLIAGKAIGFGLAPLYL